MDYKEAFAYIDKFIDYERSPDFARQARFYNLNRISLLLDLLGNPHDKLRIVHVAGSKGKGSTAALIASVLTHAGFRTGLFTSPHLITPRERCRIDNELISETDVACYIEKLRPAIETVSNSEFGQVSFFEIYTALAFTYFADKATDFAVIEVGLGGRLDATNVVLPVTTVFTTIGLEHTNILGETYTEIAREKAEIIKDSCPIALAPQHPEAQAVIESVADARNALIVQVKDFEKRDTEQSVSTLVRNSEGTPIGQRFNAKTHTEHYDQLTLPLLGQHQHGNAMTAIAAIECLKQEGFIISKESVYAGFKNVQWDGRIQRVLSSPTVVLDGAHSPISFSALRRAICESYRYTQATFIVSIMKDKDLVEIGNIISQIADSIIITQVTGNPRVIPTEIIKNAWSGICNKITTYPTPEEAISTALARANPTDLICVTGSLYLVGEALDFFIRNHNLNMEGNMYRNM